MLIEPTPAIPRTPARRARAVVAIVAPIVILGVVIGTGVLGRDVDPRPERAVVPGATPDSAATDPVPAASLSVAQSDPGAFPSRVLGLQVRTVAETLERRGGGELGDDLVAVRAHATLGPATTECFLAARAPTISSALACRRDVVLADGPDPVFAWSGDEIDWIAAPGHRHLHGSAFPGVSLVDLGARGLAAPPSTAPIPVPSVPVVVLGRFDDPRLADPRSSARHANEAFAIERVVWVAETWQPRPAVRFVAPVDDERTIDDVRAITSDSLPSGTVILSHAIADPDVLARIDPTAAFVARKGVERLGLPEPEALWYVRVMTRDRPPVDTLAGDTATRRLAWAVMTAQGTLLGTGAED
jgi:hypothetical protein